MKTGAIPASSGTVTLSKIVLGTGNFGSSAAEDTAFRILDKYYEMGGRTLDTARVYNTPLPDGASKSERTIARWLRKNGVRKDIVISTKGGHPELRSMTTSRLDRECIEYDLHTSMAVLDVDCIDLYFLHRDDESIPVGEIMDILHEKVAAGYIRAIGASNWSLRRILEANNYANANGKTPFSISQIGWNLGNPMREVFTDPTTVEMTKEEYSGYRKAGVPVMAYSAQSCGFYYKYAKQGPEALRETHSYLATARNFKRAEFLLSLCKKANCTLVELSLGYLLSNPLDAYALIGASRPQQVEEAIMNAGFVLPPEIALQIL